MMLLFDRVLCNADDLIEISPRTVQEWQRPIPASSPFCTTSHSVMMLTVLSPRGLTPRAILKTTWLAKIVPCIHDCPSHVNTCRRLSLALSRFPCTLIMQSDHDVHPSYFGFVETRDTRRVVNSGLPPREPDQRPKATDPVRTAFRCA